MGWSDGDNAICLSFIISMGVCMGSGGLEKGVIGSAVDYCLNCLQFAMKNLTVLGQPFIMRMYRAEV